MRQNSCVINGGDTLTGGSGPDIRQPSENYRNE